MTRRGGRGWALQAVTGVEMARRPSGRHDPQRCPAFPPNGDRGWKRLRCLWERLSAGTLGRQWVADSDHLMRPRLLHPRIATGIFVSGAWTRIASCPQLKLLHNCCGFCIATNLRPAL